MNFLVLDGGSYMAVCSGNVQWIYIDNQNLFERNRTHGNDTLERRTMGFVIGMRSGALLISPAIGGFLAEPLSQYPSFAESEW
jgi:hypothetical protein